MTGSLARLSLYSCTVKGVPCWEWLERSQSNSPHRKSCRNRPTETSSYFSGQWQFEGDFEQRIDASLGTWQGSDTNAAVEGRSKSSWVSLYPTCPPLKGKIASYSRILLPIQSHSSVCSCGQKHYVMKIGLVQNIELQKGTGSSLFKAGCTKILSQFACFYWFFFFL